MSLLDSARDRVKDTTQRIEFAKDELRAFRAVLQKNLRQRGVPDPAAALEDFLETPPEVVDLGERPSLARRGVKALVSVATVGLLAWAIGFFILFTVNVVTAVVLATKALGLRVDMSGATS